MWKIVSEKLEYDKGRKYWIFKDGLKMTKLEVIDNWINNNEFREFYNNILVENEYKGYHWENIPITKTDQGEDYEFVLIKNERLEQLNPEKETFKEYFNGKDKIVCFPNIRGDAMLIVPTPMSEAKNYTHIGRFVRNGPEDQIDELWKVMGEAYKESIGEERKWLSTAGLGVYWLHIRIDTKPKYYRYGPYRKADIDKRNEERRY